MRYSCNSFELNMSSFKIGLAVTVSLLICLEIGKAHINFHQDDKRNVKFLVKTCTCNNSSHCLPWCSCQNGFCRCGGRDGNKLALTGNVIRCINYTFSLSSSLKKCHCLTSDNSSDKVYVGRCAYYTCGTPFHEEESLNIGYYPLPCNLTNISAYVCARFGRKGRMCGYCKDKLSRYVLSYNFSCVKCPNAHINWWKFIFLGFGPLTCFYVFVLVFHVNITSSRMQTIVLFSQIITASPFLKITYVALSNYPRVFWVMRILGIFHSFWNLDFFLTLFNGVCLDVGPLTVYALDYAVAFYPLILIMITIKLYDYNLTIMRYLCKPIAILASKVHSKSNICTSIIDAFSTFFLLSFVKILITSFELLVFAEVVELRSGNIIRVLFMEPGVEYLSKRHLPYGVTALVSLIVFIAAPMLLLTIYPCKCFQQCLSVFHVNWHFLHTFIDSFQGCFKDSTEQGTYDLRWMSAYGLFVRLILLLIFTITQTGMYNVYASIVLVCLIIILINVEPYKKSMAYLTKSDAAFLLLLTLVYTGVNSATIDVITSRHHLNNIGIILCGMIVFTTTMLSTLYVIVLACSWIIYGRKQL